MNYNFVVNLLQKEEFALKKIGEVKTSDAKLFLIKLQQDGNITPHVCRHTYCSNQAKAGMNPKTLQYLMGHSDIGVTLNTYTHLGLEDAAEELRRMEEAEAARREQEKLAGKAKDAQKLYKAV